MELVLLWVGLSIAVGLLAARRGRGMGAWIALSVALSPLLAGLLLLIIGPAQDHPDAAPTPETHVRCPDCRELVRRDARKCKHCGITLIPQ